MAKGVAGHRAAEVAGKVMPIKKRWLNTQEAMRYLGCSRKYLAQLRDSGEIRYSMYNNRAVWHDVDSIDYFIHRHIVPNGYTTHPLIGNRELDEEVERQALKRLMR